MKLNRKKRARLGATSAAKAHVTMSRTTSGRPDVADAFVPDVTGQARPLAARDAESDAEEFVASALYGESMNEAARDEVVDEEEGGPFVLLGEDGSMPSESRDADGEEPNPAREGRAAIRQAQAHRGALWAARAR